MSLGDVLRGRVRAWAEDDPDPATAQELTNLLAAAEDGDEEAVAELEDRFAGCSSSARPGSGRARRRTEPDEPRRRPARRRGLVGYLQTEGGIPEPMVVVGFDARYNSDVFARDTAAAVVAGVAPQSCRCRRRGPVFAIRHLGADAGVMVTASHNPPQDNGYKVYLGDGSQIVPPTDAQIASHIAAVAAVRDLALVDDGWETLGDEVQDAYVERVAALVRVDAPRGISVVHTALHGVGDDTVRRVFARRASPNPSPLSRKRNRTWTSTVSFPNPEEAGAIDAGLAVAREVRPDVVIANDPDADRCAAAVLDADGWRMLRGRAEALLGAHMIERGVDPDAVFACSIVSSRLLAAIAAANGIRHEETLTGFKWISRVPGLAFGYEEALGYCVAPQIARDSDGVSAALLLAELVASLRARTDRPRRPRHHRREPRRLRDRRVFGPRRRPRPDLARHGAAPVQPAARAGTKVSRVDDLVRGDGGLPPTDGVRWFLDDPADRAAVGHRAEDQGLPRGGSAGGRGGPARGGPSDGGRAAGRAADGDAGVAHPDLRPTATIPLACGTSPPRASV